MTTPTPTGPTAGPWEAVELHEVEWWVQNAADHSQNGGHLICKCQGPDAEANAKAIARLPEVLEVDEFRHILKLGGFA